MLSNDTQTSGVLINPPAHTLGQVNAIYSGSSRHHVVENYSGPLSVKSMLSGAAFWHTGSGAQRVHSRSFLVLNRGTKYSLVMDSPVPARTFVLFFRDGFVEEIHRSLVTAPETLMDRPFDRALPTYFVEAIQPAAEAGVGRALDRVRQVWQGGGSSLSLEDEFHHVAVELLRLRHVTSRMLASVAVSRASTRQELFRRTQRARVMIEDSFREALPLEKLACEACLSPAHFHRSFQDFYGVTPHHYLTQVRLREAARLLETTDQPITSVCAKTGFESVPSFSNLFRSRFRTSPGRFRALAGKSKIR